MLMTRPVAPHAADLGEVRAVGQFVAQAEYHAGDNTTKHLHTTIAPALLYPPSRTALRKSWLLMECLAGCCI